MTNNIFQIFQYGFMVRGLEAGIIVAVIAPLIGIFLVLRRYALIADTLSHVSLAGIALGLLLGLNPALTALGITVLASLGIEKLRASKKLYNESALALYLSGSLALAIVLLSLAHGFNTNLFNYLFGSIVTVTRGDVVEIAILALVVVIAIAAFFKELVFITFDEEAAQVSGLPLRLINQIFIVLAAVTVAVSIPIVGILLIAALIVIPTVTALQLKKSFKQTLIYSEIFSVGSVVAGLILSFYLNLATGGTIVLLMLLIFGITFIFRQKH
jgi:zinc transport system permease protein